SRVRRWGRAVACVGRHCERRSRLARNPSRPARSVAQRLISSRSLAAAPSIDFGAALALSLGVPFLLRQPPLLRRPSRLRRSARFRYVERVFDEARQPFVRSLTVL